MIINRLSYNFYLNSFNDLQYFVNKINSKIDDRYSSMNSKDELLMSPSSIEKENEDDRKIDEVFKRARERIKNG